MILRLFISLLIFLKVQVNSQNSFCYVLCQGRTNCDSYQYDKCKNNCNSQFEKGVVTSSNFACYSQPTDDYLTTTNPRYQPAGAVPSLPYNIYGGKPEYIPIYPMTVTSSLTGSATNTCINQTQHNYVYYGDNFINDFFTINHPGIAVGRVFGVKLIYGIIRIDQWNTDDDDSRAITQFLTNTSESKRYENIDDSGMRCRQVCGDSSQEQCYEIIEQQFRFNLTTSFSFKISVKGMTGTGSWGIMNVVILARVCHPYCLTCSGHGTAVCYSCDYLNHKAMISGNTICALTCANNYGFNPSDPGFCILCSSYCKSCYADPYNCTQCYSNAFMYDLIPPNVTCVLICPQHSFPNNVTRKCEMCDDLCGNCTSFNRCVTCNLTYFLYQNYCYNPCPVQTYNNTATTCANCYNLCYTCSGTSTNCSVCDINGTVAYLHVTNNTCVTSCGNGFFQDKSGGGGPNLCTPCDIACLTCDINSTYCFSCDVGNYLYLNTCGPTCTQPGYFADDVTRTCLQCNVYCTGLLLNAYFPDKLKNQLYCDITFTQNLNWTTTQIMNFITITEDDPVLDVTTNFFVTYQVLSQKKYRIRIQPKGYIFLYNITFKFQTAAMGAVLDRAINGRPFRMQNYGVITTQKWFLIKAPSMSNTQKMVVDGAANMSQAVLSFTTLPYIQQIKKTGIFAYLLSGAQATSLSCLVNSIPSQNHYQGVRFWASFVFFDVPDWQADSNKTKYVVVPDVQQIIKQARLLTEHQRFLTRTLFDTQSLQWRFNRTGHTSFFIFDVYMNITLIVFCWLLIIIGNCCIEHKIKYKQYIGKFYAFTMKVHQFSIFYITLTTLMEWIFFDAASAQRWVSFIICICFNIYFFCFELYVYYDMIKYPRAQIGNQVYQYYCLKYGSLLKNIRFEQYDPAQPWSAKHWFRPYNYHIMSYYKKFLMLITLPIFYYTPHAQICVLLLIQVLQIIRFLVVWPFKSKIRNFIRFGLDFLLFVFFGTVMVQGFAIIQIMKTDPETLQIAVEIFYNIGWLGFVSCWVFNIGFIIMTIYDIIIGCRKSNRQLMDQARKIYYMQKLNTYQQENQDVPLSLINKWVKLGNLNDRKYDELPDINVRLQCYKILKSKKGYQVQMKILLNLYMNIQFNYQKDNNISAGRKHNKRFTLNKALSPQFYNIVHTLYEKYSNHLQFQYLTIKTFQKIVQSAMKSGQKIVLKPEEMFQKIQLQTYAGQTKTIQLDKLLNGFPINEEYLKNII